MPRDPENLHFDTFDSNSIPCMLNFIFEFNTSSSQLSSNSNLISLVTELLNSSVNR
jgi:hypothetical protein